MRRTPSLLPRSAPSASGVSSRAIAALLDRLEERSIELHSIMVVRHGHVVAEGWWAPYSAGRRHLLYSMTKSFTSIAVGLAIEDGLLSLDDRVVDVLPGSVPADVGEQGRRITVHHLLSMTSGHDTDSLGEAWRLEPGDLVRGFLRVPFAAPEGSLHAYDNAATGVLARMVDRVTGRGLPELLDERLFRPMGIAPEHDLVAAVTAGAPQEHVVPEEIWKCLLPGLDDAGSARDDELLAERLRRLSLTVVQGSAGPARHVSATVDAAAESALPGGTTVTVEPAAGGWLVRLGPAIEIATGHGSWRESSPLGRPVVATGAWQDGTFVADLCVITTPHRVRLTLDTTTATATATWNVVPLTTPDLALHLRSPLMTRPDVA